MGTSDPGNNADAGLQLAIRADAFVTGQQTHLPIECRKKCERQYRRGCKLNGRLPSLNLARKQRRRAAALTHWTTRGRPHPHTSSCPHTTLSPKAISILLAIADGSADERTTAHI